MRIDITLPICNHDHDHTQYFTFIKFGMIKFLFMFLSCVGKKESYWLSQLRIKIRYSEVSKSII